MKKNNLLWLLGVVIIAIFLRFYQLGVNPPSLDWDEASTGYNAYSILKTGNDEYGNHLPLSFRSFDDYKPPVYIYLTVPSVALFGLNEFAVRLPAAIFGVVGVIGVYFLVLMLLDNEKSVLSKHKNMIALISSLFLAISPWHLQFSRAAFEGNIGVTFTILGLLFFFNGLKRPRQFIFSAIFFILAMYSYHSFRVVIPLLVVGLVVLFPKIIVSEKKYSIIALALFLVSIIPIFQSAFSQTGTGARLSMVTVFSDPQLQQLSAQKVALAKKNHDVFGQIMYNRRVIFIPQVIHGYFDHFNFSFLFLRGDSGLQHHAYHMGMLYLWDFPFILAGIFFLLKYRNKKILVLFLLFFLSPLPAAITTGTPHAVRAIGMIPAFQIFSAVGFVLFFVNFRKKKFLGNALVCISIALLCINICYYLKSYFISTPIKYGFFWQYGNKQAVQYAKQHENSYSQIIMTYAYDQPYIYYLFYNKIDPAWYQKNWDYTGSGTVGRFYRKIGKYSFMNITPIDLTRKNTLLIGTPAEIPVGLGKLEKEIKFPDGRIAYKIVAL